MEEKTDNTMNEMIDLLTDLNNNVSKNTDSINHLEEFLILKDQEEKKQQNEKAIQEEEKAKADQEQQEEQNEKDALAAEKSAAKADAQQETYTELLSDGIAEMQLTNQLLSVQTIYFGIIIGLLFIKIFVDSLTKK